MPSICTLYVVRHGESYTNRDGIISGHFDTPLTERGRQQAYTTKDALESITFDEVYSSDLQRARDTATIIFGAPVPTAHQIRELRERNFGHFEGQPSATFQAFIRQATHLTAQERWEYAPSPDVESNHQLSIRFLAALTQIARQNTGKTVLVGAHGGCIRVALIQLGFAPEEALPSGSFQNAGYVTLAFDGERLLIAKVVGAKKKKLTSP